MSCLGESFWLKSKRKRAQDTPVEVTVYNLNKMRWRFWISFKFFLAHEASPDQVGKNGGFKTLYSVPSLAYSRCLIEFIKLKNNILKMLINK